MTDGSSVSGASDPSQTVATSATYYVTFYEHASYGGASYTASQSISNLGEWGWNDHVTSLKSLNGQRPKWWENAGYTPPTWQWGDQLPEAVANARSVSHTAASGLVWD